MSPIRAPGQAAGQGMSAQLSGRAGIGYRIAARCAKPVGWLVGFPQRDLDPARYVAHGVVDDGPYDRQCRDEVDFDGPRQHVVAEHCSRFEPAGLVPPGIATLRGVKLET